MPVDILDQPRGGILEATVYYLHRNGGSCSLDSLTERMTGSDEGKKYFTRNVVDLLEAVGLVEAKDDEVHLTDCLVLEKLSEKKPFEMCFKIEFLSKIMQSREPNVRYFGDVLRSLFDLQEPFDTALLEKILRESRGNRGIPVSPGEELGGKMDFCITLLRYLNMVQRVDGFHMIFVPRVLLQTIFSIVLENVNKPSVKFYSELLEQADKNYLPVLNRKETRVLDAVYRTLSNEEFISSFKFAKVSDGGRTVLLGNKEFNAILVR